MPNAVPARAGASRLFVGGAFALLTVFALCIAAASSYASAARWVEHTLDVQREVDVWVSTLLEVENGARAYIASGEEGFVRTHPALAQREREQASALKRLVADSPQQLAEVERTERAAQATLSYFDDQIARVRRGQRAEAIERLRAGEGQRLFEQFRNEAHSLYAEEQSLLAERRAEVTDRAWLTLLGASIVGLFAYGLLFFAWRREGLHEAKVTELARTARQRLKLLSQVAGALAEAESKSQVAKVICEHGMRAAQGDTCTLYGLEPSAEALTLLNHQGVHQELIEKIRTISPTVGNPETFAAMKEGRSVWVENETEYAALYPSLANVKVPGRRAKAFWSVPLKAEGKSLGLLGVGYYEARRFSPDERAFIDTLTFQCAQALLRAARTEAEHDAHQRERWLREQAERTNRLKDDFPATVSHELRTPLNAILGWTLTLRRGSIDVETDRALTVIERNARAQATLIDDVLDVSRIVSGKLVLHLGPTSVAGAVRAAIETVTPAAEGKGISITTEMPVESSTITADAGRLQQVIWNLLSNAVKFTPKDGSVKLRVFREASDVCVSVKDNGEGIRPELLSAVFEPFQQADASTTRRHGGLGLGLSIVKQLVVAHGGSVSAESEGAGKGSTFTVRLPVRAVAAPSAELGEAASTPNGFDPLVASSPEARLDGLRVLVVDDEPDARMLVREILHLHGAQVDVAASAEEARAKFKSTPPDVIVSDIGMPDEDGYAFIRKVRADGGRTPAVALTAYASQQDAQRAFIAGFQKHVIKPVEPAKLVSVVANLGGRSL